MQTLAVVGNQPPRLVTRGDVRAFEEASMSNFVQYDALIGPRSANSRTAPRIINMLLSTARWHNSSRSKASNQICLKANATLSADSISARHGFKDPGGLSQL